MEFGSYILTSLALVFVIEGLLYALFPGGIRKMMAMAIEMPPEKLRLLGAVMALTGFGLVWMLQAW